MSTTFPTASRSARRTILLGAMAMAAIVLVGRGVPAWRAAMREARAAATERQQELARARAVLARQQHTREALVARDSLMRALAATLLPRGADDEAPSRTLAALVSGAAAGADIRVSSTAVVEAADRDVAAPTRAGAPSRELRDTAMLRRVAVRVAGTGDVRGLASLLHTLERGPIRLNVRTVHVTPSDVLAGDDRPEALQIELLVEGLTIVRPAGEARQR